MVNPNRCRRLQTRIVLPFRPLRSAGLALSLPLLTSLGLLLAGSVGWIPDAQAQVVNDPAEIMIMNSGSPFAKPVLPDSREIIFEGEDPLRNRRSKSLKPAAKKAIKPEPTESVSADATVEVSAPLGEPQLDLQTPPISGAPATASGQEPLKARAVMVDISSNTLNYDKDHDVYIATGSVHMVISEQNSELYADKLTYDQNQDLAIAEGNVVIIKNGEKTYGSYAKIDLSRRSALVNDYRTMVQQVRIKAKEAFLNPKYVQYENGRIILDAAMMQYLTQSAMQGLNRRKGNTAAQLNRNQRVADPTNVAYMNNEDISRLGSRAVNALQQANSDLVRQYGSYEGPVVTPDTDEDGVNKSLFSLKMRQVDVHRSDSGYDKIIAKWPSLYMGRRRLMTMPSVDFSYDEPSGTMEYLGPDIGVDPDYGGLHFGPGWDFRVGEHGSIRLSPLVSYGSGGTRRQGGRYEDTGTGPGVGGIVHYRDPKTFLDIAYNTRVGQPVLLGERKLIGNGTRLRVSANDDYINGFLGYERPNYGLQVYDQRRLLEVGNMQLSSFSSVGWYRDEFFPTLDSQFFVDAKQATPGTAGRAQVQLDFRNTKPLLQVGRSVDFGFVGNMTLAGYSTGDFMGIMRAGPSMNVRLGDRFLSNVNYFYAFTGGDTPFVFDSYYRGSQNVVWQNAVKLNRFMTLGLRQDINLRRENARGDLLTGNQVFMVLGPKDVKFNVAFDLIRKRSYFGVNFMPGEGARAVDFEKARVFQPENYKQPNPEP